MICKKFHILLVSNFISFFVNMITKYMDPKYSSGETIYAKIGVCSFQNFLLKVRRITHFPLSKKKSLNPPMHIYIYI